MFSLLALYFTYRREQAAMAMPHGDVVTLTPRAPRAELPLAA